MKRRLLSSFDERHAKIDMVVLHAVAFEPQEAIETFRKFNVSSHYLIGEDGVVWQLVGEKHRAWHAGKSKWQGLDDINSRSIGIELCSPTLGQKPFSAAQKEALTGLLRKLAKKYNITKGNIVGHSDIAPQRKADPGKAFFWKELAEHGFGLWYNPKDALRSEETDVAALLAQIGYDTADENLAAHAFCRRFLPEKLDEILDINAVEDSLAKAGKNLAADTEFLSALRAVAYAYAKESKTPCKI